MEDYETRKDGREVEVWVAWMCLEEKAAGVGNGKRGREQRDNTGRMVNETEWGTVKGGGKCEGCERIGKQRVVVSMKE